MKDETISEKTTALKEDQNYALLQSMRERNSLKLTGMPQRPPIENNGIPSWLRNNRQIMKFLGYFQKHFVESPDENFRIKK